MNGTNCQIETDVLVAQRDLYLKPDDRILFVVDSNYENAPIDEVFAKWQYEVIRIPLVEKPGRDYQLDENALKGKTVGWLLTSVSISHSPATKKILDQGMFLISNPGITPDWPAILNVANRAFCQANAHRILLAIGGDVGGTLLITDNNGTSIFLRVPAGNWQEELGFRNEMGTNGPYGELATAPYEANGRLVLTPGDFLTNPINGVKETIEIEVAGNHVVEIKGGQQAEILKEMLEEAGDPKAYSLGEFAFGLNPGKPSEIHRSVIAEKLVGGVHVAIGSNAFLLKEDCPEIGEFRYGRYNAGVHIDCIKRNTPTVTFQASGMDRPTMILENGTLVV